MDIMGSTEQAVHPNLLLNPAEIEEIKHKVGRYPWAKEAYQNVQANADSWIAREIDVPATGGGFYHAADPTAYAITVQHYALADAARDLGLMFQLTGDTRYQSKAKEILLAYADSYLTYEYHDKAGRTGAEAVAGGRTTPQGINEATWAIAIAWAYDLIYHGLTPGQRDKIEAQILWPAAEIIMDNNEGRHNHQTWYNAGVGVLGFVMNDARLVHYALEKADSGHYFQMKQSITGDGMWYEGSMHYQFFVLRALLPLIESAYHAGIDLYQDRAYKSLFDFMLEYADASMKLPTINDGRLVYLAEPERATYYEVALRRFGDARYAPVLRASARTDLNALLYGVGDLPPGAMPAWRSRHFAHSDLVVLRSPAGDDAVQVVLNTMGYQGGHSHPDRLSLVLSGLGHTLAPDSGSIKYRVPAHVEYFKQSIAHNTIVVDRESQRPSPAALLEAFASSPLLQVARASTEAAYPGVRLERTLLLTDDYLIDIAQAASDRAHTYDWVLRNIGAFASTDLDFRPASHAPGDANGYQYLQNVRSARPTRAGRWQAEWHIDPSCHVRLDFFGAADDEYFLADSLIATDNYDEIAETPVPVLLARREAATTRYLAILQPYRHTPSIRRLAEVKLAGADGQPLDPDVAFGLQIERDEHSDLLLLAQNDGPTRYNDLVLDGRVAWVSFAERAPKAVYLDMGSAIAGDGWSLRLDDAESPSEGNHLGVHLAMMAPNWATLQNTGNRAVSVVLDGLLTGEIVVFELDRAGQCQATPHPSTGSDGQIRFVLQPRQTYELTGQP
jgi:hypothetical protein